MSAEGEKRRRDYMAWIKRACLPGYVVKLGIDPAKFVVTNLDVWQRAMVNMAAIAPGSRGIASPS